MPARCSWSKRLGGRRTMLRRVLCFENRILRSAMGDAAACSAGRRALLIHTLHFSCRPAAPCRTSPCRRFRGSRLDRPAARTGEPAEDRYVANVRSGKSRCQRAATAQRTRESFGAFASCPGLPEPDRTLSDAGAAALLCELLVRHCFARDSLQARPLRPRLTPVAFAAPPRPAGGEGELSTHSCTS